MYTFESCLCVQTFVSWLVHAAIVSALLAAVHANSAVRALLEAEQGEGAVPLAHPSMHANASGHDLQQLRQQQLDSGRPMQRQQALHLLQVVEGLVAMASGVDQDIV
jgi:hypothetical protein